MPRRRYIPQEDEAVQARSKPLKINAVRCDESPPILQLDLEGYLDTHTVLEFDRVVNEHLGEGVTHYIINASKLVYISSAGIGSLMRLVQEVRHRNGGLVVLQAPEKVYSVLDLLGFTEIFKFADTQAEAIDTLKL